MPIGRIVGMSNITVPIFGLLVAKTYHKLATITLKTNKLPKSNNKEIWSLISFWFLC